MAKRIPLSPIETQLIEQLYGAGLPTLIAGQIVAVVCFLALGGFGGDHRVDVWIVCFSLLFAYRIWRIGRWRERQPWSEAETRAAAREYRFLSLLAGILWSLPLLLLEPPMGSMQQIFTLVITIGLPMAAMPANSIYLPAYRCFMLPMLATLLYWTVTVPPDLGPHFAFVTLVYGIMLYITALSYYNSRRASLEARLENQQLIDDLSAAKSRLEEIAYRDPLTGLANRRWFQMEAEKILSRSEESGSPSALLLIDMDDFKKVNDRFGHAAGDRLLTTIADRLNKALRLTDVAMHKSAELSRYGGDEFMALLVDTEGEEGARKAVCRIMRLIAEPVVVNGVEILPAVSIGVAMSPDDGSELGGLTRHADMAMYRAKQAGRNRFCFYHEVDVEEPLSNCKG